MDNSATQWLLSIHLLLGYHANYAEICQWLQPWLHILHDILLTDEAQFPQDSITNTRNSHSKVHGNPYEVAECHFQCQFAVSMWCGVLKLIWHVIKGWLTVTYYMKFLAARRCMWPHLHFGRIMWTSGLAHLALWLKLIRFLSVRLHEVKNVSGW